MSDDRPTDEGAPDDEIEPVDDDLDSAADAPGPQPAAPSSGGRMLIRVAAAALTVLGVLSVVLTGPALFDPPSVQCTVARTLIDDANDDDEAFNDVDVDEDDADDIECDRAIQLADQIPEDEEGDGTESIPSEGAIRFQAGAGLIIGLGQAVAGFLTARTYSRQARIGALVFAGLGFIVPLLGVLSMAAVAFVVYALGFSAASRQIWGRPDAPPHSSLFGFGRR